MNCPVCKDAQLVMSERQGIEIDYCPECRGIWLDRGELDKIIERSSAEAPSRSPDYKYKDGHDDHYDKHKDKHYGDHYKKRRGFLSDLFD